MSSSDSQLVVVFPITTSAFGVRPDWFEFFSPKLQGTSYLLIVLLLIISVGIMALKRFENVDFVKKAWNVPVLLTTIVFWPSVVIGLKELVDTFNTFLVINVFGITWQGFGFPEVASSANLVALPSAGVARLLPNLAYWLIYAFYLIFFFFYAVLGPLVLAKGVLFDEIQTFLELVKEFVILLLWQTTLVILVAFIMPSIVSGKPFPAHPETNLYFLSVILGVMILFVPPLTRKFGLHIESAFVPLGFRWGGALLGFQAIGGLGGAAFARAGVSSETFEKLKPFGASLLHAEEFKARYDHRSEIRDLKEETRHLERESHEAHGDDSAEHEAHGDTQSHHSDSTEHDHGPPETDQLFGLSKKAKEEMDHDDEPEA